MGSQNGIGKIDTHGYLVYFCGFTKIGQGLGKNTDTVEKRLLLSECLGNRIESRITRGLCEKCAGRVCAGPNDTTWL